jgi:hypothetical protein
MSTSPAWITAVIPGSDLHPWATQLLNRELEAFAALTRMWEHDTIAPEHWRAVLERIDCVRGAHDGIRRDIEQDALRALGRGLRRIGSALAPDEGGVVARIRARLRRDGR